MTLGERRVGDRPLRRRHDRGLLGGQVRGERVVELRRIDHELHGRLAPFAGRVVVRDEGAVQDAVLRACVDLAQDLALFGAKAATKTRPTTFDALGRGVGDHGAAVGVADQDRARVCSRTPAR